MHKVKYLTSKEGIEKMEKNFNKIRINRLLPRISSNF